MPRRPASHEYRVEDGVTSRNSVVKWLAERKATSELLLAWVTEPESAFSGPLQAKVALVIDQKPDESIAVCPTSGGPTRVNE